MYKNEYYAKIKFFLINICNIINVNISFTRVFIKELDWKSTTRVRENKKKKIGFSGVIIVNNLHPSNKFDYLKICFATWDVEVSLV